MRIPTSNGTSARLLHGSQDLPGAGFRRGMLVPDRCKPSQRLARGAPSEVKASNVLLCTDGSVKLSGWAVGRRHGHQAKLADSAPDPGDIYGVGPVLHEALTGAPFAKVLSGHSKGTLSMLMSWCLSVQPHGLPSADHALLAPSRGNELCLANKGTMGNAVYA